MLGSLRLSNCSSRRTFISLVSVIAESVDETLIYDAGGFSVDVLIFVVSASGE